MAPEAWAARRLQKDLQAVLHNPLFNVVGEPLRDNLFDWHVNIRAPEETEEGHPFANATFHLVLKFPSDFPNAGPAVFLCTPLPHPNVALNHASPQSLWRVSLWDCMPAYRGWSSAYSVQSVLLQLQTFLLQEDLLYDVRKVPVHAAAQRARAFTCTSCGHSGENPWPAFLTPFDVEFKLRNRQKKHISRPQRMENPTSQGSAEEVTRLVVDDGWKIVGKKKKKQSKAASRAMEDPPRLEEVLEGSPRHQELAMGLFGLLPREPLTTIVCLLERKDMGAVALTCRGLRAACEDGYIWKELFQRHYPAASLTAASLEDWKHVFLLEQSNALESLRCFHLKRTHAEEGAVLGFPLSFTVNPKTREVQHVEPHLDVLSLEAFDGGVRLTADNQPFQLLLPLYIEESHFERALPTLQKTMARLSRRGHTFTPGMVLDVLPKVLNTLVVLVSDKGIQASERAIEGYCMLHRLFLALCDRFSLWRNVHDEVIRFRTSGTKEKCSNLGHFLSLLSVCSAAGTHWKDIVRPLTNETFDRNVLWNCKHDPSAKEMYISAGQGCVDDALLRIVWEGSRVSLRLNMFHAGFLQLVARPSGVTQRSVIAQYDKLFGMPSAHVKKRLREFLLQVLRVFGPGYDYNLGWAFFFRTMGMVTPSKTHFCGWLGQCWRNSLRKGYHTLSTEFERIHSSGVSRILLKGESYSAPPNMKKVQMAESWGYTHDDVQYLDASCLVYNSQGEFIAAVDFDNRLFGRGAIRHSGDQIDHAQRRGTHTMEIALTKLPAEVTELYFTLSGYMGPPLREFRLPYVEMKDCETATELCGYNLEGKSDSGEHTAVVMCRMFRGDHARWEVEALGFYSGGDASNYGPMNRTIEGLIGARKSGASG